MPGSGWEQKLRGGATAVHTRHQMKSEGKRLTMEPGATFHGEDARERGAVKMAANCIRGAALRVAIAEHNDELEPESAFQRLRGQLTAATRSRRAHLR